MHGVVKGPKCAGFAGGWELHLSDACEIRGDKKAGRGVIASPVCLLLILIDMSVAVWELGD